MADNTILNLGAGGDIIATDEISGVKHQRVKIQYGVDGSATDVSSGSPLPTILAANSGIDIGDVDVTSLISGTGATNLGKAIDAIAGATDTGVASLVIRDDVLTTLTPLDGDYVALRANARGALWVELDPTIAITVDGSGVTQPISGTVTANAGTGIFTVDGSGVTQPVSGTVTANAGAGTFTVDGSGVTQPVSGTVTANAGTGAFNNDSIAVEATALGSGVLMQGDDGTDRKNINVNATTGNIQVDVVNTVTVASHDVTNTGTFAVQAAIDELPIAVAASDNFANPTTSNIMSMGMFWDGAAWDRAPGDSATGLLVNLGSNNDVTVAGVATAANQLPDGHNVTVDNASGAAAVNIQDGGNSITVDNAGTFATQATLQANSGIDIGDVDVTSIIPGIGATNLGKAIDSVAGATDTGIALLAVRDDVLSALTPIDGDYVRLRVNSTGSLWTEEINSAAILADTASMDTNLATVAGAVTGTEMQVDVLSLIPGTAATDLGKAVDSAAGATDTGVASLAIRDDTLTTLTPVDGDYVSVRTNIRGAQWVELDLTNSVIVEGPAAEDAAVLGNPLLAGGRFDASARVLETGDVGALAVNASGHLIADVSASTGGTATDDATFTAGSDDGVPIMGAATTDSIDSGDVGVVAMTLDRKLHVATLAATTGGASFFKSIDLDETEEEIKATAGQIYFIHAMNLATTVRFLKIYNATAATVVVGTTVPDLTFPIPTQGDANGAGFVLSIPTGLEFGTAITVAATTGIADNDAGGPGGNEVIVNIGFI